MKIKIFNETYPPDVEDAINEWLGANPGIRITHVAQSQIYSDEKDGIPTTISIFYQESVVEAQRTGFQ